MDNYTPIISDEERTARRAQRAESRRKKKLARRIRRIKQISTILIAAFAILAVIAIWHHHAQSKSETGDNILISSSAPSTAPEPPAEPVVEPTYYHASETINTIPLGDAVTSNYAILINLQNNTILAEKDSHALISPASMTKILTLLVAAEQISNLDDSFTMTFEITDYCYANDCSVVGLEVGETVSVRELLYGAILPSGADAALGLATYVAGSQEAFVELMNKKVEELGLADTAHFENCIGLYSENNVCTVYDMAMILKAAMDNPLCREILNAHTYDTAPTTEHPEGQVLSNWFLRRIEDVDTGKIEVIAAKTGYVTEAGSCAASCGRDANGNLYLCVTGSANSSWRAIYDHAALYKSYCGI